MLSVAVERHVALMRACGFLFDEQAALLTDYAAFAKARGDVHVRTATVLDWSRKAASRLRRRTLYLTVRRFALVMVAEDACHECRRPICCRVRRSCVRHLIYTRRRRSPRWSPPPTGQRAGGAGFRDRTLGAVRPSGRDRHADIGGARGRHCGHHPRRPPDP